MLPRLADGRTPHPSAAILDSRTLQSTSTSGARAGYDGAKHKKGSKIRLAVDTLGICWRSMSPEATNRTRSTSWPRRSRT